MESQLAENPSSQALLQMKQTQSETDYHFDCFKYFTKGVEETIGKIREAVG
jgi:hypothetical protein